MNITDVRIRKLQKEGKMRGIVSVTFDNEFVIHDVKIIEDENKFFIAMPSRKITGGEFKDIAHPINSKMREKIQEAVLYAYKDIISNKENNFSEAGEVLNK